MNGKKKKTFLNIAILALLISGMFYCMNEYLINNIKNISDEVVEAKKTTMLITERNKKIEEVRKNYDNIEKEIGLISETFVEKNYERVGEMFMDLERVASKYNVELINDPSSKGEKKMGANIYAAYFTMSATGEYDDLMKFLLNLDNFKYYIDLNNLEVASNVLKDKKISNVLVRGELVVYLEDK